MNRRARRTGDLSVPEVAKRVKRTPKTVRVWIHEQRPGQPKLKARQYSGYWWVSERALEAFCRRWALGGAS